MRGFLFLIVTIPFVFILLSQFRDPEPRTLSEKEKVIAEIEGMTFNTPKIIRVLSNEQHLNKNARQQINTLILRTDEEYLPRAPRVPDNSSDVIEILKKDLPNFDFGTPVNEQASYFRWLTSSGSEWMVSSVQTSNGFFSRWENKTDIHELKAE